VALGTTKALDRYSQLNEIKVIIVNLREIRGIHGGDWEACHLLRFGAVCVLLEPL
jgi:hypothetical protein